MAAAIKALSIIEKRRGHQDISYSLEQSLNAELVNMYSDSLQRIKVDISNDTLFATLYNDGNITTGYKLQCKVFQFDVRGYNKNIADNVQKAINDYIYGFMPADNAYPDDTVLTDMEVSLSEESLFVIVIFYYVPDEG